MSDSFALASDYERVTSAIAFMQSHSRQPPDLAAMARHVHLSEHHLQQLFNRWAGIGPQRFVQLLTVESTKQRLTTTQSWLMPTLDAGLLRPHRRQTMDVHLEAIAPSNDRQRCGAGLAIAYGLHPTRFGTACIACTERGICSLQFCRPDDCLHRLEWLREQWPQAKFTQRPEHTQSIADLLNQSLIADRRHPLTVLVQGTNFQIQVWRALLTLPLGSLLTYQDIANRIGKPKAARAVGTAIGANPVGYLIPCHRVIRATGEIGGYRWEPLRKTIMLGWEAAQCQENV